MRVKFQETILDIPDGPMPTNPETVPEYMKLKELVDQEFIALFDRKIDIRNWDYILHRAFLHKIS
jgi:hypothetical protein